MDQVARYVVYIEECRKSGKQEPKADGVLIFDEVKVASQLMWNSRSHQLMGLAMTSDDYKMFTKFCRIQGQRNRHLMYCNFYGGA